MSPGLGAAGTVGGRLENDGGYHFEETEDEKEYKSSKVGCEMSEDGRD